MKNLRFNKCLAAFLTLLATAFLTLLAISFLNGGKINAQEINQEMPFQEFQEQEQGFQEVAVVATVNFYNAKIISQDNSNFKISFELSNREGIQSDIKYGVELLKVVGDGQNVGDGQILVDQKTYPEIIILGQNEVIKREIDYSAPSFLKGEFELWLVSNNSEGLLFAVSKLGNINLNGDRQFVEIAPGSCFLTREGDKKEYNLTEGVPIDSNQKLFGTCKLINHFNEEIVAFPRFENFYRISFGEQLVADNREPQTALTLKAGEERVVSFVIPRALKPQAYDAKLMLFKNNQPVSNPAWFHYVVSGESATIQNLVFDKDLYQQGETAKMSFFWSERADSFWEESPTQLDSANLSVAIKNRQGEICGSFSRPLDDTANVFNLEIPILKDCLEPMAEILIKDKNGNILANKSFLTESLPMAVSKKPVGAFPWWIRIIVILVFVIAIIFLIRRFRETRVSKTKTLISFLLFFIAGAFLMPMPHFVRADTFSGGWCTFTVNLDATKYSQKPYWKMSAVSAVGWGLPYGYHFQYESEYPYLLYRPQESMRISGSGAYFGCSNFYGAVINLDVFIAKKQTFLPMPPPPGYRLSFNVYPELQSFSSLGWSQQALQAEAEIQAAEKTCALARAIHVDPLRYHTQRLLSPQQLAQIKDQFLDVQTLIRAEYGGFDAKYGEVTINAPRQPGTYKAVFLGSTYGCSPMCYEIPFIVAGEPEIEPEIKVDAGLDKTVNEGESIAFSDARAYRIDNLPIQYSCSWNCTGGNLDDETKCNPTFQPPLNVENDTVFTCTLNVNVVNPPLSGLTDSLNVTAKDISTLRASPSVSNIIVGEKRQFTAFFDADGSNLNFSEEDVTDLANWSSSKDSVITVDNSSKKGMATAVGPGAAIVEARYKGKSGYATVNVKKITFDAFREVVP